MTRLIDADAVKYEPLPKGERNYRTYNLDDAYDDGYNDAMFDIDHMPTVDAVPVRHGMWKGEGMGEYSCSLCGKSVSGNYFNYCPHCGAKMDDCN